MTYIATLGDSGRLELAIVGDSARDMLGVARGTPVVARRRGSTPEIVQHGRTGFLADTDAALVETVGRIEEIDRTECRRHVERHFSVDRMVDDYETVYRRLLTRAAAA